MSELTSFNGPNGRINIISCLSKNWIVLAYRLGLDRKEVTEIKQEYQRDLAACQTVFSVWLRKDCEEPQTWGALLEALDDIQEFKLADQLKRVM